MNRRGEETDSCDAGVRVRMRNEGKQLDPSKACQNGVGQERVTDWRGVARLLALLFSWARWLSPRWAITALATSGRRVTSSTPSTDDTNTADG